MKSEMKKNDIWSSIAWLVIIEKYLLTFKYRAINLTEIDVCQSNFDSGITDLCTFTTPKPVNSIQYLQSLAKPRALV